MASSQLRPAEVEPEIRIGDAANVGEKVLVDPVLTVVVLIIVTKDVCYSTASRLDKMGQERHR